jgi:hypothetical protein
VSHSRAFIVLATAITLACFGMYAPTVNLVPLLTSRGSAPPSPRPPWLCGAGQLLGRVGYPSLTRRTSPRTRTMLIFGAGTGIIALLDLLPAGPVPLVIVTATLAGAVRGTMAWCAISESIAGIVQA